MTTPLITRLEEAAAAQPVLLTMPPQSTALAVLLREAAEALRALQADKAMLTGQLQASRAMLAASPQGEGLSGDPAPIKPSGDTGELRERVALEIRNWPFDISRIEGCLELADAILDLIQSKRAG